MPLRSQIPSEPRYTRTKKIALEFIVREGLCGLPVEPKEIALRHHWKIEEVGDIAKDLYCSHEYVLKRFVKSKDGAAYYCDCTDEYKIVINEKIRSRGRIRWTLMHEIGHIVLNHLKDYNKATITRGLNADEYDVLEKEAHYFAGQILAPPVILYKLNVHSVVKLKNICSLSDEAAAIRYSYLIDWINKGKILPIEQNIISQFYNFIYKKKCNNCGYGFISKLGKRCPICGAKLIWGDGNMIYDGFELNDYGRACTCPICGNEEIEDGNYCKICGVYIINKCTNEDGGYDSCGHIADGNARFCIYCGCDTTFFKNGLLKPWDETTAKDNDNEVAAVEDTDDLPF